MSLTGYNVNDLDLIYIFKQRTSGNNSATGFLSGGMDLSNIFQPYDGISVKANPTNYFINSNDLNNIFQNLKNYVTINYNPFSADTSPTGYTYQIFSVSTSIVLDTSINDVNLLLVGGGGGGGTGFGWNGGGAGGEVIDITGLTLQAGTYNITIGQGGIGGKINIVSTGGTGGTTSIVGPGGFNYSATGGGGGQGGNYGVIGSGGTNGSSPAYGTGGSYNTTYTNVQPGSGVYTGDGQNGYLYTFSDGTGTTYYFGGGGGGGGRNLVTGPIPNTYLGGGGFVGTRNGITFTNNTGGCGGTGYYGIVNGDPGFDFSFNGINYDTGAGAGAGGNSDANYCVPGGVGNSGLVLFYYPSPTFTIDTSSNLTFTQYNNNGYTGLVFEVNSSSNNSTASITFNIDIPNATIIIVGGGGGGLYDGGGGGGTTYLINYNIQKNITYSLQVGKGGTGFMYNQQTLPTSGSESYFNDNNTNYIGYGGTAASTNNNESQLYSGDGGNSSVVQGGGGGSGGLFGFSSSGDVFNSIVGSGGSNNNQYNFGCQGIYPIYNTYGGNGGDSFYKYVYIPFLQNISSSISVGGGGGGGGNSQYGGNAGQGIGGNGASNGGSGSINGGNGTNSITTGYGGGGGGFSDANGNYGDGGNGGNGVVIIYYGPTPTINFSTNGTITISTNYWFVIFTDTNNQGNITFNTNNNVEVNYLIVGGGGSGGAGGENAANFQTSASYSGGGGSSGQILQSSTTIMPNSVAYVTLGKGGTCTNYVPSNGDTTSFNNIQALGGNFGQNGVYQYPSTPAAALGGASVGSGSGAGGNGQYGTLQNTTQGSSASGYNNIYTNFTIDNINLGTFGGGGGGGGVTSLQYFGQGSGANGGQLYSTSNLSGFNGGGGGGATAIVPTGQIPTTPTYFTEGGNGGDGIVILWFSKNIS